MFFFYFLFYFILFFNSRLIRKHWRRRCWHESQLSVVLSLSLLTLLQRYYSLVCPQTNCLWLLLPRWSCFPFLLSTSISLFLFHHFSVFFCSYNTFAESLWYIEPHGALNKVYSHLFNCMLYHNVTKTRELQRSVK